MRVSIHVDSATPQEVYHLTRAFRRTAGFPMPQQIMTDPTVTVGGSAMGWTSPALTEEHARALLAEFHQLVEG